MSRTYVGTDSGTAPAALRRYEMASKEELLEVESGAEIAGVCPLYMSTFGFVG